MYQHQEPTQAQIEWERFNLGLPDDPDDKPNNFPWTPRTIDDYADLDSYYWRARDKYLNLINDYAGEHNSLKKGLAYANAWIDELFPDGLASLTWEQVYNDLQCHREHPPRCDCNGINNPNGCPVCRVSAAVDPKDYR